MKLSLLTLIFSVFVNGSFFLNGDTTLNGQTQQFSSETSDLLENLHNDYTKRRASSEGARITSAIAYDNGTFGNPESEVLQLDVQQNICDEGEESEKPEDFFDTILGIKVVNNSNVFMRLKKFSYVIKKGAENGKNIKGKRINVAVSGDILPGETTEIFAPFLDVTGDRKRGGRTKKLIPVDAGFKNVKLKLVGINALGKRVRITGQTSFSFGDVNNCTD